ncbi:hypothetical protein ACH5RR_031647 [Cinchona calisaya]|uniref:Uncharacterized protein n=1 Tax=Cinchona calisaya TaxID=153742 RepID=A0ABD2YJA8_9GENT
MADQNGKKSWLNSFKQQNDHPSAVHGNHSSSIHRNTSGMELIKSASELQKCGIEFEKSTTILAGVGIFGELICIQIFIFCKHCQPSTVPITAISNLFVQEYIRQRTIAVRQKMKP